MNRPQSTLAWGLLGAGAISHTFAEGLGKCRKGRLVAIGSRDQESANKFAAKFGGASAYGDYESVLSDPSVDIIYVGTPHSTHAELCIKAANAKKHILCEKPIAVDLNEAKAVVAAARENSVFLMEGFMYRCHPQTAHLVDLIHTGVIGRIGVIRATYSSLFPFDAHNRRFNRKLGGGGILDLGCYTTSISRLIAGAALGLPYMDPEQIIGFATNHPETEVDLYAVASARFPEGILAQLTAGVGLRQGSSLQIFGAKGVIEVPTPFVIARNGGTSTILLRKEGRSQPEEITITSDNHLWALEADSVAESIFHGCLENPNVTLADSLGNMAALDKWRQSAEDNIMAKLL